MKKVLLICLALLTVQMIYSQRNCGSMEVLEKQLIENPQMRDNLQELENFTTRFIKNNKSTVRATITIPVVAHVVYNRRIAAENISEAQIQSQIDVLNEDFGRYNSDADNTWSQASATNVQFCLASVDPSGNSTDGITRTSSRKRSQGTNDGVKFNSSGGKDAWPASDYLNIWICNIGGSILGYAQFPGGDPATDGIVLDYRFTGTTGTATAPFDLGRTGTHEVGHWLNLRHIWGDGGCSVDDFVSDTPVSDGPNYSCDSEVISCTTVDMIENYMDYTDDVCMNLFTSGQSARMDAVLAGLRSSLFSSNGCGSPNGGGTCSDGVQNGAEQGIDCGGSCPDACPPVGSCDAPTGLRVNSFKRKNTQVGWSSVSGASSYSVEYRNVSASIWSTKNATGTSATIKTEQGENYEWRVTATCSSGDSDPSVICTFTGNTSGTESCNGARITNVSNLVEIFPNPAYNHINIDVSNLKTNNIEFLIYNSSGQLITDINIENQKNISINISDWKSGLYMLNAQLEEGNVISKRFIVIK